MYLSLLLLHNKVHCANIKLRKLCFAGSNILLFVLLLHTFDVFDVSLWFTCFWQCHNSYSACDLGSDGTDRLVNLVREVQHRRTSEGGSPSLFGAKITGGGSGGTVCVVGKNCARSSEEIAEVAPRTSLCSFGVWVLSRWQRPIITCTSRFSTDTRLRPGICPFFSTGRLQELGSLVTWRSDVVVPSGWLGNEELQFELCHISLNC